MRGITLPDSVRKLIDILNRSGHRADIVGGSVRDFLLGNEPSDYDITTSATPEEMKKIFASYRTVETGIKHGTLTVLVDSVPYEITTYRQDGDYKDHRHPESVSYSRRIEDDLSRRDFTMNAIAYNEKDGITDIFFGAKDIENKTIRAVGDAATRFSEDALRILRALRFAAKLGFKIDAETANAARNKKSLLSFVSGERIFTEWKKLLDAPHAYSVISEYKDVISEFLLPGEEIILPREEEFIACTASIKQLSLILLSARDARAAFLTLSERLRFDNETKKEGIAIIDNYEKVSFENNAAVRRTLYLLGEKHTRAMLDIKAVLGAPTQKERDILSRVLESAEPYTISSLAVRGTDMLALGIKGKEIARMLEYALFAVIDGTISNNREEIINYIKSATGTV